MNYSELIFNHKVSLYSQLDSTEGTTEVVVRDAAVCNNIFKGKRPGCLMYGAEAVHKAFKNISDNMTSVPYLYCTISSITNTVITEFGGATQTISNTATQHKPQVQTSAFDSHNKIYIQTKLVVTSK
jgi:hypothetical protein